MSGFEVWSQKELLEISRTWRRFVLPVLLIVMAVLSPVFARIAPELVRSFSGDDPGVIIQLPDPTAQDALRQWGQSLDQIVLMAVIVIAAGLISSDLAKGAGQLALVKPLSRRDYVLAKVTVLAGYLAMLTIIASAICGAGTWILFAEVPWRQLVEISALWLVLAGMFICIQALLSTLLRSQTAAAGAGIAIYFVSDLVGLWRPLNWYSPAGLMGAYSDVVSGKDTHLIVPIVTAVAVGTACLGTAIAVFERQSLR